jgi:hypothetical protein
MSPIHFAVQYKVQYDRILKAMSFGLAFRAKDEDGNLLPSDLRFLKSLEMNFEFTFKELLGYDRVSDLPIIKELEELYRKT